MNLFTSFMRTVVPVAVGLVVGLADRAGFDLNGGTVTAAVTAGLTAGYYALFRLLEETADRAGAQWLRMVAGVALGWARPPEYPPRDRLAGLRPVIPR